MEEEGKKKALKDLVPSTKVKICPVKWGGGEASCRSVCIIEPNFWSFPGGPVVRTSPPSAEDTGLILGS